MPRLAANLSLMYTEFAFMQRFAAAAADGFEAVEFLFPYAYPALEIAAQLQQHGLQQVLLNAPPGGMDALSIATAWDSGMRGTACLPGREAEFQRGVRLALDYAQQLGCPRIHLMAGIKPPGIPLAQLHATYVSNLRWAADQAASVGCTVLVEPINPFDMPGYYLSSQATAHDVCAEVNLSNCKVQMDLYHCAKFEGDIRSMLHQYLRSGNVAHLQIAGVPDRHEPDNHSSPGSAMWPGVLKLIDTLGYTGWIGCEYRPRAGTSAGLGWAKPWLKA